MVFEWKSVDIGGHRQVALQSATGGRWAELQGHVDGLSEALQEVIRRRRRGVRLVLQGVSHVFRAFFMRFS